MNNNNANSTLSSHKHSATVALEVKGKTEFPTIYPTTMRVAVEKCDIADIEDGFAVPIPTTGQTAVEKCETGKGMASVSRTHDEHCPRYLYLGAKCQCGYDPYLRHSPHCPKILNVNRMCYCDDIQSTIKNLELREIKPLRSLEEGMNMEAEMRIEERNLFKRAHKKAKVEPHVFTHNNDFENVMGVGCDCTDCLSVPDPKSMFRYKAPALMNSEMSYSTLISTQGDELIAHPGHCQVGNVVGHAVMQVNNNTVLDVSDDVTYSLNLRHDSLFGKLSIGMDSYNHATTEKCYYNKVVVSNNRSSFWYVILLFLINFFTTAQAHDAQAQANIWLTTVIGCCCIVFVMVFSICAFFLMWKLNKLVDSYNTIAWYSKWGTLVSVGCSLLGIGMSCLAAPPVAMNTFYRPEGAFKTNTTRFFKWLTVGLVTLGFLEAIVSGPKAAKNNLLAWADVFKQSSWAVTGFSHLRKLVKNLWNGRTWNEGFDDLSDPKGIAKHRQDATQGRNLDDMFGAAIPPPKFDDGVKIYGRCSRCKTAASVCGCKEGFSVDDPLVPPLGTPFKFVTENVCKEKYIDDKSLVPGVCALCLRSAILCECGIPKTEELMEAVKLLRNKFFCEDSNDWWKILRRMNDVACGEEVLIPWLRDFFYEAPHYNDGYFETLEAKKYYMLALGLKWLKTHPKSGNYTTSDTFLMYLVLARDYNKLLIPEEDMHACMKKHGLGSKAGRAAMQRHRDIQGPVFDGTLTCLTCLNPKIGCTCVSRDIRLPLSNPLSWNNCVNCKLPYYGSVFSTSCKSCPKAMTTPISENNLLKAFRTCFVCGKGKECVCCVISFATRTAARESEIYTIDEQTVVHKKTYGALFTRINPHQTKIKCKKCVSEEACQCLKCSCGIPFGRCLICTADEKLDGRSYVDFRSQVAYKPEMETTEKNIDCPYCTLPSKDCLCEPCKVCCRKTAYCKCPKELKCDDCKKKLEFCVCNKFCCHVCLKWWDESDGPDCTWCIAQAELDRRDKVLFPEESISGMIWRKFKEFEAHVAENKTKYIAGATAVLGCVVVAAIAFGGKTAIEDYEPEYESKNRRRNRKKQLCPNCSTYCGLDPCYKEDGEKCFDYSAEAKGRHNASARRSNFKKPKTKRQAWDDYEDKETVDVQDDFDYDFKYARRDDDARYEKETNSRTTGLDFSVVKDIARIADEIFPEEEVTPVETRKVLREKLEKVLHRKPSARIGGRRYRVLNKSKLLVDDSNVAKYYSKENLLGMQKISPKLYLNRMFKISLTPDAFVTRELLCNAFLTGNRLITVWHMIEKMLDEEIRPGVWSIKGKMHAWNFTGEFNEKSVRYVYKLPGKPNNDDLGCFVLTTVPRIPRVQMRRFDDNTKGERVVLLGMNNHGALDDYVPIISSGYMSREGYHDCPTEEGDCAAILISMNDGAVLGFHNGGSINNNRASPVTLELEKSLTEDLLHLN